MTAPASKTMFSYFTKLPSKAVVVEESNPRKLAPAYNKQHVEEFQTTRLERFDAELFNLNNNNRDQDGVSDLTPNGAHENGSNTTGNVENQNKHVPMDLSDNIISCATYIDTIKSGRHKPFRLNKKPRGSLRARLLQYHEDIRPPYYGTWQRKSKKITGRRPFALDEDMFDYEVDSEAEWDIGGPGESLKGDDSDDQEELDDYEIDMQTFVPHGYVSDDEVDLHSDQEEAPSANQSMEGDCDERGDSNSSVMILCEKGMKPKMKTVPPTPPTPKQRQAIQQQQSPAQTTVPQQPIKQVKLEIKPITLGLYYENEPSILSDSKIHFLRSFQGASCK